MRKEYYFKSLLLSNGTCIKKSIYEEFSYEDRRRIKRRRKRIRKKRRRMAVKQKRRKERL